MSFQNPLLEGESEPISEINMTPLVDVMLVLLIVFMITMPVVTHSVNVKLPQVSSTIEMVKPDVLSISVDEFGVLGLNGERLTPELLEGRLMASGLQPLPPEVRILADENARYSDIAFVMSLANRAGLNNLSFVSLAK